MPVGRLLVSTCKMGRCTNARPLFCVINDINCATTRPFSQANHRLGVDSDLKKTMHSRHSQTRRYPHRMSTATSNYLLARTLENSVLALFQACEQKLQLPLSNISSNSMCTRTSDKDICEGDFIYCVSEELKELLSKDIQVIPDFITEEEEEILLKEIEPHLKRQRYETSHWDDAIHGYRETQMQHWTEKNKAVLQRVRDIAFNQNAKQLGLVHILDLKKDGYIKPHVDAVKFCGSTIAGISLLSSAVMRFVHTEDKTKSVDALLSRRSLYIMKDDVRFNYTHEVLKDEESEFNERHIPRDRRISVICRIEPTKLNT